MDLGRSEEIDVDRHMVIPVYGYGWIGKSGEHIDVPDPFEVEDIQKQDSERGGGVWGKVISAGHIFSGLVMYRTLRHTGYEDLVNVSIHRLDDVFTYTDTERPLCQGYAKVAKRNDDMPLS